jgi:hypothetical protein
MIMHLALGLLVRRMKKNAAQKYAPILRQRFGGDVIALLFVHENHLVFEEPIAIKQRVKGKSTINIHTAIETVREIVNIVMMFNPSKIFFPIFTILFILGVGWGVPIVLQGKGVSTASSLLIVVSLLIFLLGLLAEQLAAIRKRLNK